MNQKGLFWKRVQYWMDGWFSSGPMGPVLSLGALSLLIILIAAIILVSTGLAPGSEPSYNFIEAFWTSMVRALGGGSMGGRETAWGYRLLMFAITLASIFVVSLLIGTLTNSITARIDELRKGRTIVAEKDHMIILGWTDQIFSVLHELVLANEDRKGSRVVVMAQRDKTFMEDTLRRKLGRARGTRIICRTGNPMEPDDLKILNLNDTRSIIILSPEGESRDADVIKTVLAVTNQPGRRGQPFNIVASICDPRNFEAARVAGKNDVEWIPMGLLVARVIAQTALQPGLSVVYSELLNYRDNEIYFHAEPSLAGCQFGELLSAYHQDSPIGILVGGKQVRLNPPMDTTLQPDDQVIVIARDNSNIRVDSRASVAANEALIQAAPRALRVPESTLILGWNWRLPIVIENLDRYMAPGSRVTVLADQPGSEERLAALRERLTSLALDLRHGDTTDRHTLDQLPLEQYQHVIVMSYSDARTQQQADASTLMALLHLRDIADKHGYSFTLTSEMLDDRNRKLAMVTRADDFVVSDRMVSMMMAQVAENHAINMVFEDLLNPEGSEIYVRPVRDYVRLGERVSYATLVEAARRVGEAAIGYRLGAAVRDPEKYFGIVINPPKDTEVNFSASDSVIVLSE